MKIYDGADQVEVDDDVARVSLGFETAEDFSRKFRLHGPAGGDQGGGGLGHPGRTHGRWRGDPSRRDASPMAEDETQTGVWITDRRGRVYTAEGWDVIVEERQQSWRETLYVLMALAYLVAFMLGGTALFIEEAEHQTGSAIIGGVALAFALGLTIGRRSRPEPEHTTVIGERPEGTVYELHS